MIALPPFWQFVALLATHWVGDFVLQTNCQATNKSKRLDALSLHVATYTVAAIILFGITAAVIFAAINGALHFVTDYITSRASSKLWEEQNWHRFL